MKLTLEHTETLPHESSRKVVIEIGNDCLTIDEMWDDLIKPALLGMTFAESTVDSFLSGDCDKITLPDYDDDEAEQDEPPAVFDPAMRWQTRDGREVTALRQTGNGLKWCLAGYVGNDRVTWTENGRWSIFDDCHPLDLIPAKEDAP